MRNIVHLVFLFPCLLQAQVIPDLMREDNYRSYLSEEQLQQDMLKNAQKEGYPRTSKQLYPHLYKHSHQGQPQNISDPLGLIPDIPDPSKAIPNYANTNFFGKTTPSVYQGHQSARNKQQLAQYERDRQEWLATRARQQKIIEEAHKTMPRIRYDLGEHNGKPVEPFVRAYSAIRNMLMGKEEVDFLKAVFLLESSYDHSLTWEEFSGMFNNSLDVIGRLMIQDGFNPKHNMAKIMSIFKYMADTTEVYFAEHEKPVVTKPMLYDYEDYGGKQDIRKVFVSKLLRTGSGQCMSLPMLYYLYAKALGAKDVHIAVAPEHTFITFKDGYNKWHNIELTGRSFTSDDFQWQGGFVKAPQVRSGIYLHPLTEQETLAYLLTTLSLTYIKSFGNDNRAYDMALTAKEYFPNSLTANMIVAGYFQDLCNHLKRQYGLYGLTQEAFSKDQRAQALNKARNEAVDHVLVDLGYEKIPDWHYQIWLESINELARKKQHLVKRRQLEQQIR